MSRWTIYFYLSSEEELLKAQSKEVLRSIRGIWQSYRTTSLSIEKILRGGELGFSSEAISIHYNDLLWGSKLAVPSPHSLLLQEYQKEGDRLFEEDHFKKTEYYQYGVNCIDHFYNFFEAYQKDAIIKIAKHFVNRVFHPDQNNTTKSHFTCYSNKHSPVLVSPIEGSSYFQLEDGYHRLAESYVAGNKEISAHIKNKTVLTPLQKFLLKDSRAYREKVLHQPLNAPEVAESWPVRMPMNLIFCEIKKLLETKFASQPWSELSCLDVGARYGWLVEKLLKTGVNAIGIENDFVCLKISKLIYKLNESNMISGSFEENMLKIGMFDIVTCLDEMPRCFLNASSQRPDDFLRSLTNVTNNILVISMGKIYRGVPHPKLSEWTPVKIKNWLASSNYFEKIDPIELKNNNSLFICYKKI